MATQKETSLRGTKQSHDATANNKQIANTSVIANAAKQSHDAKQNNKQIASSLAMTQTRVPKLRFKEFEDDWEEKKLGDVGKIRMCKRVFSGETMETGDIPFFKIGTFGKDADAYITKELYLDYRERFSYPKVGDILMSASGTLGRTVIYDGSDAYFQDSNIVWIDNKEELITNRFLFYIYQIVRYDSEGGTIQRLYNNIINSAKFSRPNLPEQQKIANFLTAVDTKLKQLTTKKEALTQYKKGVMQQLFSQQLRFKPDNTNTTVIASEAREKQSVTNKNKTQFPDWEEKRLGEVCESIKSGKSKSNEEGSYPLYGSTGVIGKCENYSHDGSFILIARVGANAGTINVVNDKFGVSDNTLVVICNVETHIKFTYFFLDFYNLNRLVFGSGQPLITGGQLKSLKLKFPCYKEQQKIATYLSAIDLKREAVQTQITKTQAFKKGLLQQMFV